MLQIYVQYMCALSWWYIRFSQHINTLSLLLTKFLQPLPGTSEWFVVLFYKCYGPNRVMYTLLCLRYK